MVSPNLDDSILSHASKGYVSLTSDLTAEEALAVIRHRGLGERVIYFYVLDAEERLVGVVPTRRLLMSPLSTKLEEMMIKHVVAIPATASVLLACELFAIHRFFAMPVVDKDRRMLGIVDVSLLTSEVFDLAERQQSNDVFEALGFNVFQVRDAAPVRAWRFRFPWLIATICSGSLCAMLVGAFEHTIAKSLVLAFFLPLVLGLGESVSVQSLTVTIQALRSVKPTWQWYLTSLRREVGTGILLGIGCSILVTLVVWLWRGQLMAATAIGLSVLGSVFCACLAGLTVPTVLHGLRLDPKIAAGPLTLAACDVCILVIYFGLGSILL